MAHQAVNESGQRIASHVRASMPPGPVAAAYNAAATARYLYPYGAGGYGTSVGAMMPVGMVPYGAAAMTQYPQQYGHDMGSVQSSMIQHHAQQAGQPQQMGSAASGGGGSSTDQRGGMNR